LVASLAGDCPGAPGLHPSAKPPGPAQIPTEGGPAMPLLVRGSQALLCLGASFMAASAHNGSSLRGGFGGICTGYSQCGGQHWTGCTRCPGDQVCEANGLDPWTKVCVDRQALELNIKSEGDICTAHSQCGGQNWTGCSECPGDQVCESNGMDPWTKVCVDPYTKELTSMGPGSVCTICSQCGGQQWTGCTECPGGQRCVLKDATHDPWTKVCVDDPLTLSCYR